MKIVFIGAVEFSRKMLKKLILMDADLCGVVTKSSVGINADFADLSGISEEKNIPVHCTLDINSSVTVNWIRNLNPDVVFCFGLSQLLKKEVLSVAPMGVIGYHPAALPRNRGRHPIIWAIVLGLTKTASTFFFMDEGADTGDILNQKEMMIDYGDDAGSLYNKMIDTASLQLEEIVPALRNGAYKKIPQEHSLANAWRRRVVEDGRIDFRMDSRTVYNLVRGLTKPYAGAHVGYKGRDVKVWKAVESDCGMKNDEYGKVLNVENGNILVKCSGGAIIFTKHEFNELPKVGEYLL